MTAAIIALAIALAGAVGLLGGTVIWLTRTALADRARTADTLFDLATAHAEVERAGFELAATKRALDVSNQRSAALERSLIDAIEDTGTGDLAPDDVRGRVLRLVEEQARRRAEGDLPAEPSGPVLVPTTES